MKKSARHRFRFGSLILTFILMLSMLSDLREPIRDVQTELLSRAEAGIEINNASTKRAYVEYSMPINKSHVRTAGILRRTLMYVYAKKGEIIYLGSDIYDSVIWTNTNDGSEVILGEGDSSFMKTDQTSGPDPSGHDIVIISPENVVTTFDTRNDDESKVGYIGTHQQELSGPNYDGTNEDGYIPHVYHVEDTGVYEIRFHSYSGNREYSIFGDHRQSYKYVIRDANGNPTYDENHNIKIGNYNDPKPISKNSDGWVNTGATVGAWDITVVDPNETNPNQKIKSGRTYTECLALNVGANDQKMTEEYYVVTNDGYIYRTIFDELDPFGFIFFSNNRGLIDKETNSSTYHSYQTGINTLANLDSPLGVTFQNPMNKDTETDKTFRIFFEKPDPELTDILYPKAYVPDKITEVEFIGSKVDNISYVSDGGYFKFFVNKSTSATVTISFDSYNEDHDTDYAPVFITANAYPGYNYFYWDGCDGNGRVIPQGYYVSGIYVSITNHAGEYHFPLFDVETSDGRIYVERVNRIYEYRVGEDGYTYDVDVTDEFDDQKYNVYYNNKLTRFSEEKYPKGTVITDEDVISELGKYSVNLGPKPSIKTDSTQLVSGISNNYLHYVYVLNKESTAAHNPDLSDEELEELYASAELGEDPQGAYYDIYLVIADQLDRSDGIDSYDTSALHFENRSGDLTAIDIWTYSLGEPTSTVLRNGIIIEDLKGYAHANLRGKVFFDSDRSSYYEIANGDYGLANIKVTADYTYTENRWQEVWRTEIDEDENEVRILDHLYCPNTADGTSYALFPTDDENVYRMYYCEYNDDGEFEDEDLDKRYDVYAIYEYDDVIRTINVSKHHAHDEENQELFDVFHYHTELDVHLETKTDINGFYHFTGILMLDDPESLDGKKVEINISHPGNYYEITTEDARTGDFNLLGEEYQEVSIPELYAKTIDDPKISYHLGDVGYYYNEYTPPIILKKEWQTDVSSDKNRPESVTYSLIGTGDDGVVYYQDNVVINYYDSAWTKTLEHLPAYANGHKLTYSIKHEIFEKNGRYYLFDGENYYYYNNETHSRGAVVNPPPYSSTINNEIEETITGHYLTVTNLPQQRTIEIEKRYDEDRSILIEGAVFNVKYRADEDSDWEDLGTRTTNQSGRIIILDAEIGEYLFTETYAPSIYDVAEPFSVFVTEDSTVFKRIVYDPASRVTLDLTKKFTTQTYTSGNVKQTVPIIYANQRLEFKVEFAYDENFTQLLEESYEASIRPVERVEQYSVMRNAAIPYFEDEVYVRITEMNGGSYNWYINNNEPFPIKITATGDELASYEYTKNEIKLDQTDRANKSLVFKLRPPVGERYYTKYDIEVLNKADDESTLTFQKLWVDTDLNPVTPPTTLKAVYAKLKRKYTASDGTEVEEYVKTALGGTSRYSANDSSNKFGRAHSIGEAYKEDSQLSANDKSLEDSLTNNGAFVVLESAGKGWQKNFTNGTYWHLPKYTADGRQYTYFAEEVVDDEGRPCCLIEEETGKPYLSFYERSDFVTPDRYEEIIASDKKKVEYKVNGTLKHTYSATQIDPNAQSNYFLVNTLRTDLKVQITKNKLSSPNEAIKPLANAQFTLYSNRECTEPIGTVTTNENGRASFDRLLKLGDVYYLKETRAPTGYMIDDKVIKLEYNLTNKVNITEITPEGVENRMPDAEVDSKSLIVNITRTNTLKIDIPPTGVDFTAHKTAAIGLMFMAAAAVIALIYYRKLCKKHGSAEDK